MDLKFQQPQIPLSIRRSFTNKTVFVIGATGFLGKVWLTQLLSQIQTFRKIYILIRGKGTQSAYERFENLINSSYVFEHLHQKFKYELSNYLRDKIEIIEGDVSKTNLGISDEAIQKLSNHIDLTVNFAGLVDFNPELTEAFNINVQGAINVADFVQKCTSKKLVHISTCYVAGTRQGNIEEKVFTDCSPNNKPLSIDDELQWIDTNIKQITKSFDEPEQIQQFRKMIEERNIELEKEPYSEAKTARTIENVKRKKLRNALIELGTTRAQELGWTNTYTYTKGLAEIVLLQQYPDLGVVIFRPSIVESSFSFPFAGWNEGFNTSGPLAYLMKSWFRHLPLKKGNPFDVIPVDYVARGLSIASASLLDGNDEKVYHCCTSDCNRLTIDQACKYTSESHSIYYKEHGSDWRERFILSRWKTIPSRKDHLLSTSNFKKFFSRFEKITSQLKSIGPLRIIFQKPHAWALRTNRKLEQIENLLELFYPFIHDYRHIFITKSLFKYDVKEPELEFSSIRKINWEEYWKNIQMPGLRKWCFPAIEAKSVEKFKPAHSISFQSTHDSNHTNGHEKTIEKRSSARMTITPNIQINVSEDKKVVE